MAPRSVFCALVPNRGRERVFFERIYELRKRAGLTQDQLGAVIGVSKYSIHLYEKGTNYPDVKGLIGLADYFNVSIDYLVGRTDNPEVNR